MERQAAAVTCDGRLFHRRAAATGNALWPTVDRRVRRTSGEITVKFCNLYLYTYLVIYLISYLLSEQVRVCYCGSR